jgi:hypothetical protein
MSLEDIANQLKELNRNIILIYAFNSIGKTRLSVAFKDVTKKTDTNEHVGVYYNALVKIFLFGTMTQKIMRKTFN